MRFLYAKNIVTIFEVTLHIQFFENITAFLYALFVKMINYYLTQLIKQDLQNKIYC